MRANNKFQQPLPLCALLFTCAAVFTGFSAQADNWEVDGEHGELQVYGTLMEGACQLTMASQDQQVDLGPIASSTLRRPGDSGLPVPFTIKLTRCVRSGGVQDDRYTGRLVWDAHQPVVTLSFLALAEPMMPSLIKASGASGVALRLEDAQHRTVVPGERGEPQFLTPDSNVLTYTVTPVRTPAPLTAGFFRATVNFQVSYD